MLLGISLNAPVHVKMTVTAFSDELCQKIEPHVIPTSQRFEAVHQLSRAGIVTGILLMPVLPFITDTEENIAQIVQEAHRCGARYIYPAFGVTLRDSQRAYFYARLDEMFPGIKERYIRTFGNSYECASPKARKLWDLFSAECRNLGILYRMADIIALIRGLSPLEQLRLF